MIRQIIEATGGSVRQVCRVLRLPRSSFYHAAEPTPSERDDQRIGSLIEAVFRLHRRRYGYRRIREELADRGEVCAASMIRQIMAQRGLRAIQPKKPHSSLGYLSPSQFEPLSSIPQSQAHGRIDPERDLVHWVKFSEP